MSIPPFTIKLPQHALYDLRDRLDRTRWPNETTPTGWLRGVELTYLQERTEHWCAGYDRTAAQAQLNRFNHYLTELQGLDIHFIHQRSGRPDAVPIVPSLPGFDFSDQHPAGTGEQDAVFAAEVIAELMEGLGYDRYLVHGGDWGAAIGQEIARTHPDRVIGLHLTEVPFANMYLLDPTETTDAEKAFVAAVEAWGESFAGYVVIQSTRPLALAYGLSDSPSDSPPG